MSSLIGVGGYGSVYQSDNDTVIKRVKLIDYEYENEPEVEYTTLRELAFLNLIKHPNIVKKISQSINEKYNDMVDIKLENAGISLTEWAGKTSYQKRGQLLPLISFQVLKALYYLEVNNIVHGDLKPSNILINPQNNHVTVIDFGGVCFSPSETDSVLWCSTSGFRPPEHLKKSGQQYIVNTKNDIFSFALTMFSFYFNKFPKQKYIPNEKYDLLHSFDKNINDLCYLKDINILKILYKCLSIQNSKRPLASTLYHCKYFRKYRSKDEFKYEPVGIELPSTNHMYELNKEYNSICKEHIKDVIEYLNIHFVYYQSMLLLDKLLLTIDFSEYDKNMLKYISVGCVQITYLLLNNSRKTKDELFYNYDDYNVYFIDAMEEILPLINFDTYVKII